MINYNPKNWIDLIFSFNHSDTIRTLWKPMIYIGLLTAGMVVFEQNYPHKSFAELTKVFQLLGFVLSLLLLFRTNTAYDRWWEGRRLWGAMVNDSRNLALKINGLDLNDSERAWFARFITYFAIATKEHLRNNPSIATLFELSEVEKDQLVDDEGQNTLHIPLALMNLIRKKLPPQIPMEKRISIEQNLNGLIDSLGACERIRNTPIPYSYSLFFKKFIFIFVILLPLGFVEQFGFFAILLSVFFFYVLVSVELLAEEIEDPFGLDENDLPLDNLCETIRRNCQQVLIGSSISGKDEQYS
jgi:putative membrane protein